MKHVRMITENYNLSHILDQTDHSAPSDCLDDGDPGTAIHGMDYPLWILLLYMFPMVAKQHSHVLSLPSSNNALSVISVCTCENMICTTSNRK